MLTNTAVFFICWKKSLLQSPLVAGVKEQVTTMKSDSAVSWGVDTEEGRGSIRCSVPLRNSKRVGGRSLRSPLPSHNGNSPDASWRPCFYLHVLKSYSGQPLTGPWCFSSFAQPPGLTDGDTEAREGQELVRVTQWDLGHFGFHQRQCPTGQWGEEWLESSLFSAHRAVHRARGWMHLDPGWGE